MEADSITFTLALLGGFISFVSPCVLPLVPAYIAYLTSQAVGPVSMVAAGADGGTAEMEGKRTATRAGVFFHGLAFVFGFTLVFVLLGTGVGLIGSITGFDIFRSDAFGFIAGTLIVIMGLHTMGVVTIPFLAYDTRRQQAPRAEYGYIGSGLMGVVFSAGWSPCIGPILGAVLTLAANSADNVSRSAGLLAVYSLGLGVPFLLTALAMDRASEYLHRFRKHMHTVELISGGFLILIGVLVFTGRLQALAGAMAQSEALVNFSTNLDLWLTNLLGGG